MNQPANRTNGLARVTLLVTTLAVGVPIASVHADDQLPSKPVEMKDAHISWHDFRHELGSYPQVTASMSSDGVITLWGHASDGIEKRRVASIAENVQGATEIRNNLTTD